MQRLFDSEIRLLGIMSLKTKVLKWFNDLISEINTINSTLDALPITNVIYLQDTTENVPYTTITNGLTYSVQVLFSVQLPTTVPAGSIITVTAMGEITNEQNYNLEVGRFIKIGTNTTDATFNNYIIKPVADNCTPANHHWVIPMSRQYYVASPITNGYINFCIYGVSSSVQPGQTMTVEQGYGHLDVKIEY